MEKEFVSYEIALQLKELGFNEPCFYYYNTDKKLFQVYNKYKKNDTFKNADDDHNIMLSAPLYQQVFRWFIEKYDLRHSVFEIEDKNKISGSIKGTRKNNFKHYGFIDFYDTDEEAELECLKKLIEIVKTNDY